MFFGDHNPPHFHARYSGHSARCALNGEMLAGEMPAWADRLIREWTAFHQAELESCWERITHHEAPGAIEPLP